MATTLPFPATGSPVPPTPVDLASLTRWELQVIFYAAGLRWHTTTDTTLPTLAGIVVDQINTLGIDVVREIGHQVKEAVATCQWPLWEGLLPGNDARHEADWYAILFLRRMHAATNTAAGALAAWHAHPRVHDREAA